MDYGPNNSGQGNDIKIDWLQLAKAEQTMVGSKILQVQIKEQS